MINLNIEDWLHLIQGVDKKVSLRSVDCTNVSILSNYANQNNLCAQSGSSVSINSKIILAYEIGFDITICMDLIYAGIDSAIVDTTSLLQIINNNESKLALPQNKTCSESHLFDIKNEQIINGLKSIYHDIRDLSCRDNFAWIANERKASLLMEEYKMALALNPFKQSQYFEDNMRKELHETLIKKAGQLIVQ